MYQKLIANLFYLTLTCTILSPYIGGATLYLYVFIPLLDNKFYSYVFKKIDASSVKVFVGFVALMGLASLSAGLIARILSIAFVVLYCFYTYEKNLFYLYRYTIFNVLWGIAQFSLTFVDPTMAALIGPTAISQMIWGAYAGPSNTNFYSIFLLTRVSGLAREAGFFASLLTTTLIVAIFDRRLAGKRTILFIFLAIGFLISLSKMTLAIFLAIPIFMFRRALHKTGIAMFFVIFMLGVGSLLHMTYYKNRSYLAEDNISITHRTSGYVLPADLDVHDFLFGISPVNFGQKYRSNPVIIVLHRQLVDFDLPGWGGVLVQFGVIALTIGIAFMALLRIDGFYFAILTLLSINISPLAVTVSTAMAWFAILLEKRNHSEDGYQMALEDDSAEMPVIEKTV